MASKFLSWGSQQIPRLILGLFWGSTELGLFSLAARLGDILMEVAVVPRYAVARVELRRYADDLGGLRLALQRTLTMQAVFCFPVAIGGAAIVPILFRVWLDPQWVDAIVPAQLLLLSCVPLVTQYIVGGTLLAMNFQKAEALVSIVQTAITVVVVLTCAPFGLLAASVGIAARPLLVLPLSLSLLKSRCGVDRSTVLRPQMAALGASVFMGTCVWILQWSMQGNIDDRMALPVLVAAGMLAYGVAAAVAMPVVVAEFVRRLPAPCRRVLKYVK